MDIAYIKKRVAEGESDTLEFKTSTAQLKSACETLCAFLNGAGGLVIIGVNDKQKLIGQMVTDKTKREIGNAISKIAPIANIQTYYLALDNEKFLIALVANADIALKPYTYEGRAYIRIESTTIPMSRDHYHHFIAVYTNQNHLHWENQIVEGAAIEELDHQEVMETVRIGIANGRIPHGATIDNVEKALQHLDLMHHGKLTNAAIVLFGKHPQKWLSQCLLKLARFYGDDHLADFIDNRQFSGNIFRTIDEAMTFANRFLPIASHFPAGSLKRQDTPLFPQKALREIFANAVCHKDYTPAGSSISFAIYNNRLEIWNCGVLPFGISIKDIKTLHKSIPRNPKIAKVLYYRQVIESWGRGIELIINECVNAGHPEPKFISDALGITVTLPSKQSLNISNALTIVPQVSKLSTRQTEVLTLIQRNNPASLAEIKQGLTAPLAERTLQDDLAKLKKLGFIKVQGRGRSAKWLSPLVELTRD